MFVHQENNSSSSSEVVLDNYKDFFLNPLFYHSHLTSGFRESMGKQWGTNDTNYILSGLI